jgi:hypothetical protein
LDPVYAKGVINSDEGKEEVERLYVSRFADWGKSAPEEVSLDNIQGFTEQLEQEELVNIKIKDILARDVNNTEKVHLLKAEAEEFDKTDLEYIVANAEGKPKKWASQMLEDFEDTTDEDEDEE